MDRKYCLFYALLHSKHFCFVFKFSLFCHSLFKHSKAFHWLEALGFWVVHPTSHFQGKDTSQELGLKDELTRLWSSNVTDNSWPSILGIQKVTLIAMY